MKTNKIKSGGTTMSSLRVALLAASVLAVAAPAFAQEGPQVDFPPQGDFENLTPSAGNDTVTVSPETALYMPIWGDGPFPSSSSESVTIDFQGGNNVINNDGYVFVGVERGQVLIGGSAGSDGLPQLYRDNTKYEAYMRAENLTTFNNTGDIYLGAIYSFGFGSGDNLIGTDRYADDILSLPGATFVGGDGSRIFLDVNFNSTAPQTACSPDQRITEPVEGDTGSGSLPVADCIDLTGGSASGRTAVHIHDILFGDRGAYNPDGAVIVDVEGGDASPTAFYVGGSANGDNYDPRNDGGIDKGLFLYTIGYDSSDQKFRLYGVQSAAARQLPLLVHAASDLWRTSTGGWFERQTKTRDEGGHGGGVWGRVAYSRVDRGVTDLDHVGDKPLSFDNSYQQDDTAITFGADLISADGAGGSWTLGGMIGYAHAKVDFDDYANSANLEGMQGGVYGAFEAGRFFADGAVNGTWLDLDSDVPAMNLAPAGTKLATTIHSLGARVETGLRLGHERFRLEPIAGVSYVRTSADNITVPANDPARLGGEVIFDDATSLRANVGLRLSVADFVPLTPTSRLSVTARQGKEFKGQAKASIINVGPDAAPVANSFDGQFSELSATFTAGNADETVAGYVNFSALFGDDYDANTASMGLRFNW